MSYFHSFFFFFTADDDDEIPGYQPRRSNPSPSQPASSTTPLEHNANESPRLPVSNKSWEWDFVDTRPPRLGLRFGQVL